MRISDWSSDVCSSDLIATAEAAAVLGAKPVYVDIDPITYNLNPALIEAAITPRTRAIVAVSLSGQCADFDAINAIADRYGITVIDDAAQSFGATSRGRRSCALSPIATHSFFPSNHRKSVVQGKRVSVRAEPG